MITMACDYIKAFISVVTRAVDKATGNPFSTGPIAKLPLILTERLLNLAAEIHGLKQDSIPSSVALGENFELRMDNGYLTVFCYLKDENSARKDQMQKHIGELITAHKLISEAGLQTILDGHLNSTLEGGSFLAAAISSPAINHAMDQMSESLSIYEQSVLPDQCLYRSTDI